MFNDLLSNPGINLALSEKLLTMIIFINVADILATYFPVDKECFSFVFEKSPICVSTHKYVQNYPRVKKDIETVNLGIGKIVDEVKDLFGVFHEKNNGGVSEGLSIVHSVS